MNRTRTIWATLGVLYLAFFVWYTPLGGPLTEAEITRYLTLVAERGHADEETLAILRSFLESDTGDDFVIVNVIDMHETPLQVEGVSPGETSQQVLDKYMEYMLPALLRRACHPVFYGTAASGAVDVFGIEGARDWSTGAGMRYRSRRDMIEIATNPAFHGFHQFKIAAMRKTIAFPVDPWGQLGDPRLVLGLLFLVIGFAFSWLDIRARWRRIAG